MKFDVWAVFVNLSRKFKFHLKPTLHGDVSSCMTICRWIILRVGNIWNKSWRKETQNTYFIFSNFFSENLAVYKIVSKNVAEPERPQTAIWRMRIECWIIKGTCAQGHARSRAPTTTPPPSHTHRFLFYIFFISYFFLFFAFPLQHGYVNAPQYYVIHTLPVMYNLGSLPLKSNNLVPFKILCSMLWFIAFRTSLRVGSPPAENWNSGVCDMADMQSGAI